MYDTTQQFNLVPLHWVETSSTTGLKKLVAITINKRLVIQQSAFDKTYDLDVHTECTTWNLHFGCKTIEEAKELAWEEHCKQLRNCLLPVDLLENKQEELPL